MPYQNYTVTVRASVEQGLGIARRVTFRTSIAAARNVTDVMVTSARNADSGFVSLSVTWTPGDFTGPTTNVILIEEETTLDSNNFRALSTETVTGYNSAGFTKDNVLAFWRYRVSVLAMTEAGNSSWVGPVMAQTTTNIPGGIRNISVVQDDTVAQEMILMFVCPEEQKRNGRITRYVIRKTLLDSEEKAAEQNEYPVVPSTSSTCENTYSASDVGGIQVGQIYTFAVKVENQDFSGAFSDVKTLTVEPKAPLLSALILSAHGVTAFTKKSAGAATKDTAIAIIVCSSCLLDGRQGSVERVGLIVCVVGDDGLCPFAARRRRSTVQLEDFTTWGKASQLGFTQVYRATPETWIGDLNTVSTSYTYIVGADEDCRQESDTVFCNGPLPADATIRIAVIQCNAVGCVLGTFEGPFAAGSQGGEQDNNDDDALKIGIGVAVAVVAVLVIVIIIIVIIYRRRKARQANRTDDSYSTVGANMKDAHLYYGVGGNLYASSSSNDQRDPENRVSMVGLSQSSGTKTLPKKKDDDDYLEPDHYDFIGDNMLRKSGDKRSSAAVSGRYDAVDDQRSSALSGRYDAVGDQRSSALSGRYDAAGDQQRFTDIYYDELQRSRFGDTTEGYQNF